MFTNSSNENVSQQYIHFRHIVSWSVIHLRTPHRTDACALCYLAITTHLRSYAQKAKHIVKCFILEMKHIMVPLTYLVNTVGKLYTLKIDLFYHDTDLFSHLCPFISFSCGVLLWSCLDPLMYRLVVFIRPKCKVYLHLML